MANVNNEALVEKAVITADAIASVGKLSPAQSDAFIDYIVEETVLKNNARVVRFRNESLEIDKIGIGKRAAMPKAEAQDPGKRRGITTSKITLMPKELMVPIEIGDNFRENNIEGDDIEDHLIKMFAKQLGNDLEELYIGGDPIGPAVLESNFDDTGSTTQYVLDTYLKLVTGWIRLADASHVVDAGGASIGLGLFSRALRSMPTKFRRNKTQLRWFMSPDLWQIYLEKLATRATVLGDQAALGTQGTAGPFGIDAVPVPLWDFITPVVEHVTITGTAVALRYADLTNVVVTPTTLGNTPITPFINGTDYTVDTAAGTITVGAGAISSGTTVKVTYLAPPQLILTHQSNFIVGIGREIRIEKDRDIFKGVNQYAISAKVDVQFEETDAIVKVKNIGRST